MAMEAGERYTCSNPDCGCEIEVTRGANEGAGGDQNPRCCCGREMHPSTRERERVA
ncbi:MAG: hypothetical protein ACTHJX_05545 [Terriglobales bacterium]|jgi:hypothetical protein